MLLLNAVHDADDPRREHEGADQLQETCTLVLQNLALSPVGRTPLRANARVMAALHRVSTSGLITAARQYASGALFVLQTDGRNEASIPTTMTGQTAVIQHVMLSYNWSHQDIIKRLNVALKARGYGVWIDIEKMQGSTIDVRM